MPLPDAPKLKSLQEIQAEIDELTQIQEMLPPDSDQLVEIQEMLSHLEQLKNDNISASNEPSTTELGSEPHNKSPGPSKSESKQSSSSHPQENEPLIHYDPLTCGISDTQSSKNKVNEELQKQIQEALKKKRVEIKPFVPPKQLIVSKNDTAKQALIKQKKLLKLEKKHFKSFKKVASAANTAAWRSYQSSMKVNHARSSRTGPSSSKPQINILSLISNKGIKGNNIPHRF